MASKFTEEMLAKMEASAPLNFAKATAIAEEFGLKPKSVVAGAIRNGIKYESKPRVSKAGTPVVRKADLVSEIGAKFGIPEADLEGLEKATRASLEALLS
jgi:hypothetical protein